MNITLNGQAFEVPNRSSLESLVESPHGIAVARNGEVVRAADWARTVLHEGDAVEIVTARQGG
jgi:sulfur carrier protein